MVIQLHKNNITNLLDLQDVLLKKQKFSKYLVELWIECPIKKHFCPSCKASTSRVHDYYMRSFNHIKVGHKTTKIYYNQRRYVCLHCGKKFAEQNSFIQKFYRHSNAVVNSVFDELTDIKNLSQIAIDNNMSAQNVSRIMTKFIPIFHNTTSLPEAIGIDEFRGNAGGNKFQVAITDLKTHKVIDIISDKSEDALYNFFRKITNAKDVKLVTMDLSLFFKHIISSVFLMLKLLPILFTILVLCIGH